VDKRIAILEGFQAAPFIRKWHYSGKATRGSHHYFGWFIGKEMYAVADYGLPTNNHQAHGLASELMINVTKDNLVELKRLCRVEPKQKVQLTQFLAHCHRILKGVGVVYVMSFSDPAQGHDGGIYKAANFEHVGQTNPGLACLGEDGQKHHRKYPFNYAKNNGCTIKEAYRILRLKRLELPPKDRWLLCINKRKRQWSLG